MFDTDNNFTKTDNISDIFDAYFGSKGKINKEWSKDPPQKYIGQTFQGNLHKHGFYFVEKGDKLFYDGLFYANKLEGYAQIFYNDGSNFQGLFKDNIRFGPGIFTYPNGEQDVGLWNGQRLARLGGLDENVQVPRLTTTSLGQLKLLKYRYLVPVCNRKADIAQKILEHLGANERVLNESHRLYNLEVENKRNLFFNKTVYNNNFFTNGDCYIDINVSDEDNNDQSDHIEEEEQSEEAPPDGRSDINTERIRQISEQLEAIESKLQAVQNQKSTIKKKVDHCRKCCCPEYVQEHTPSSREKKIPTLKDHMGFEAPITRTRVVGTGFSTTRIHLDVEGLSEDSIVLEDELSQCEEEEMFTVPERYDSDHICESTDSDVMTQIKNYLTGPCVCEEELFVGDLNELETQLEAVTRDVLFYESIRHNLKKKLEKHLQNYHEDIKVKTKKVLVKDVLAWNNEHFCRRMLKHSFHNRRSEYMVNFKVSDLLAGNRTVFGPPGRHERNCKKFLAACSEGNHDAIFKQVRENDINVNLCDAKGNSALFFAAANCHANTIKVLMNLGAKLDQENDEGLFPLSMCILQYIAEKYNVEDWEKSFLKDNEPHLEQKEAYKWYSNMSLLNLMAEHEPEAKSTRSTQEEQPYVFFNNFVIPTEEDIENTDQAWYKCLTFEDEQLHLIEISIKTLLGCGANPNGCEAPLPPLIMSIFTERPSLVECILAASADVNTTIEDDVTSLHIIASSKCCPANVDICRLLLAYDVDPKLKTTPNHWPEQKAYILGKDVTPNSVKDNGKTPLHILCMRRDFPIDHCSYFQQMLGIFYDANVDFSDKYLGHTPLSLAVLVGNQKLVESILKLQAETPYQKLDYDMGNVLTIYTLKKYEDIIPPNAKEVLKCLVDLGVNPLKSVDKAENAIAFMEKEEETKGKKKDKTTTSKDVPKKGVKDTTISQKELKEYLKELSRNVIIKYVQLEAVDNLYNLIEEGLQDHEYVVMLAEFLNPYLFISNLHQLVRHGRIKSERYDRNICLQIIDIITEQQKKIKLKTEQKGKSKKSVKGPKKSSTKLNEDLDDKESSIDFGMILDMTDFTHIKRVNLRLPTPPGLDNVSKYKVCFHCLRKLNKVLLACPRCQLIYFCSDACNKANLKLDTLHTCNINFYSSESKRLESPEESEERQILVELYKACRENCEKRWMKKMQEEKELQRKQLEEEMKKDIYGLKYLRKMREMKELGRTPTVMSLFGSLTDVSKMEGQDFLLFDRRKISYNSAKVLSSDRSDPPVKKHVLLTNDDQYKCRMSKVKITTAKEERCTDNNCTCETCIEHKHKGKYRCTHKRHRKSLEYIRIHTQTEIKDTVKKLREIPSRYEEFIELLNNYFPDTDFSSLFLPYACYSNGHLYYKFRKNDLYTKTYSMM